MDPNETLFELLYNIQGFDEYDAEEQEWARENIAAALRDLAKWIENGGFMPKITHVCRKLADGC